MRGSYKEIYGKDPTKWVTWRGLRLPIDEDGNIMKIKTKRNEYQEEKRKNDKTYQGDLGKVYGKHAKRITDNLDAKGLKDKLETDYLLRKIEKERKKKAIERIEKRAIREKQKEYHRIEMEYEKRIKNNK